MANRIRIEKVSIVNADAECIVNAANAQLQGGTGVCGAIFKAAGWNQLQAACDRICHCDTGSAVITPAFNLKAKYIIHAVGPIWQDGNHREPKLLYSCYQASLKLAKENGCHSIAFPLISAGIYGYPKEKAWRKAIQACKDFMESDPEYGMDVTFAILDDEIIEMGKAEMKRVLDQDMLESQVEAGRRKKADSNMSDTPEESIGRQSDTDKPLGDEEISDNQNDTPVYVRCKLSGQTKNQADALQIDISDLLEHALSKEIHHRQIFDKALRYIGKDASVYVAGNILYGRVKKLIESRIPDDICLLLDTGRHSSRQINLNEILDIDDASIIYDEASLFHLEEMQGLYSYKGMIHWTDHPIDVYLDGLSEPYEDSPVFDALHRLISDKEVLDHHFKELLIELHTDDEEKITIDFTDRKNASHHYNNDQDEFYRKLELRFVNISDNDSLYFEYGFEADDFIMHLGIYSDIEGNVSSVSRSIRVY